MGNGNEKTIQSVSSATWKRQLEQGTHEHLRK